MLYHSGMIPTIINLAQGEMKPEDFKKEEKLRLIAQGSNSILQWMHKKSQAEREFQFLVFDLMTAVEKLIEEKQKKEEKKKEEEKVKEKEKKEGLSIIEEEKEEQKEEIKSAEIKEEDNKQPDDQKQKKDEEKKPSKASKGKVIVSKSRNPRGARKKGKGISSSMVVAKKKNKKAKKKQKEKVQKAEKEEAKIDKPEEKVDENKKKEGMIGSFLIKQFTVSVLIKIANYLMNHTISFQIKIKFEFYR
jgi:hypothetical protein